MGGVYFICFKLKIATLFGKFGPKNRNCQIYDVLMLTFLRSRKRIDPSVACFVLQVSIKKPTYCQLLTSFRRSNRMFVDVFIECFA